MASQIIPIIKQLFTDGHTLTFGPMYFKRYVPKIDNIVSHFSTDDWSNILGDSTEEDIIDLSSCCNVIVLIWYDSSNDEPIGMLYIDETYNKTLEIYIHGGTCNHNPKYHFEIFRTMTGIIKMLIKFNAVKIKTSCSISNIRANRFQESLGFKTIDRNNTVYFKELDFKKFSESDFANRF